MNLNINEYFEQTEMSLSDWDFLLDSGWDRVGDYFFRRQYDRYELMFLNEVFSMPMQLMPLRYRLSAGYAFPKSHRIIQKRNADLHRIYRPAFIDQEKVDLFNAWYSSRFQTENSIFTWVSGNQLPFPSYEVSIYKLDKLIACSFFDVVPTAQYSTLAMFDPEEAKRSLGTYSLISEIEFGLRRRKKYHYPGHAYYESSMYDYKKRFVNAEAFDWHNQDWRPIARLMDI